MKISLCMIIKNEEQTIERCLTSIQAAVDEIIIVDTGSTDRSKEIVQKFNVNLFDFPWIDDFAKARNFAFDQATGDYLMWLDADDVVPEKTVNGIIEIKQAENPADVYLLPYQTQFDEKGNPTFSFYRERIVKNDAAHRFEGAIHEVIPLIGTICYKELPIQHHKEVVQDADRNLRIFEQQKAKRSLSPRELYYYGRELMYHQKSDEAIDVFQQFLNLPDGWVENKISACEDLGNIYRKQGKIEEALYSYMRSFFYGVPRVDILYEIGYIFMLKKEYSSAAYWFLQTLHCPLSTNLGFHQQEKETFLPSLQLCVCYFHLQDYEKAYQYHLLAQSIKKEHPSVLFNQSYFEQSHPLLCKNVLTFPIIERDTVISDLK